MALSSRFAAGECWGQATAQGPPWLCTTSKAGVLRISDGGGKGNDFGNNPASPGRYAEGRGYGMVLFASVMLVIIGCYNLIYGIAVANSHVFTANAHYVFANLRAWGWITFIIGMLQLLAAAGCWRATSWRAGPAWPRSG